MIKLARILLAALILSLGSLSAKAHPHTWIDLETAPLFNEEGKVTGLWVGWLFDDFYSAFTLNEMKPGQDGEYVQKALNALAETNLKNLAEFSYFTFLRANGKPVKFKPVSDYKTSLQGNRLWMEFTVELETAIDPKTQKFDYAVYDPTFYVEILHAVEGDPIQLSGEGSLGCNYALKKPEPPEELSLMAAALDKDETAGTGIGESFAERVEILCD